MNVKLTDPSLLLTFEANDLEPGHSTSQTISSDNLVNRSFSGRFQKFSQLKSSSDQISLQIKRKCPSTEDIIATDGNVRAVLKDGEEVIYTGYISTSYKWVVTNHGEQALSITIEGVGTRLLNQPFIETGKFYFDCPASAAVYNIVHPLGITIHSGDERKILQNVSKEVEAGDTCRDLLDSLFYECNAVYWFNNLGELRIDTINPSTVGAQTVDYNDLYVVGSEAVSLNKTLRAYKGARITYKALGHSSDYLVYRNTTNATATRICELTLQSGEYFDGAEIYTAAEWTEAMADEFREPTLIGAVNAASESAIVGSNKIVNITNLVPDVLADAGITVSFEAAGGPYFKLTCHNTSGSSQTITKLDLKADIVYEKSDGVIRTQIDGSQAGKSLLEEDLVWIHDKENATAHANLVSQYFQYAGATYTFRSKKDINTGTVIRLKEDLYSGLDVYVLITAREFSYGSEVWKYTAVGISTFDLTESAYHGTTEPAKQSGAQGPAGEPGASTEVQYALGDSIINPPGETMQWGGIDMLWSSDEMLWNAGTYSDTIPTPERGKYIWMRTRVGDAPWQYTRLTGSTSWDPENLGVCTTACPTQSKDGLGLIPGDYFVAGDTFHDPSPSGPEYKKGYAYYYTGTGWSVLDLSDPSNSGKALQLAGSLFSTGINVEDSTASIWGWFQNLIAQNAVIDNLTARLATIENLIITGNIVNDVLTTNNATSATGLTFTTVNKAVYNADGTLYENRRSVSKPVIDTIFGSKSGTIWSYSGTITIDGTSYTATSGSPIRFTYEYSKNCALQIKGSGFSRTYMQKFDGKTASSGYLASYTSIPAGSITSNMLTINASSGSISVHSVLAQDSTQDNIGSSDVPFANGYFKELTINASGMNYNLSYLSDNTVTLTGGTAQTLALPSNGKIFIAINAVYDDTYTYMGQTGLLPFINIHGQLVVPTSTSSFKVLEYTISKTNNTIYLKAYGVDSNKTMTVQYVLYK